MNAFTVRWHDPLSGVRQEKTFPHQPDWWAARCAMLDFILLLHPDIEVEAFDVTEEPLRWIDLARRSHHAQCP